MDKIDVSQPIPINLDGTNYILWAQEMSSSFIGHKLRHYVTTDISESTKDKGEVKDKLAN